MLKVAIEKSLKIKTFSIGASLLKLSNKETTICYNFDIVELEQALTWRN